jgi:beta-lactamase regulating signal transducer with metallopeptidase domain
MTLTMRELLIAASTSSAVGIIVKVSVTTAFALVAVQSARRSRAAVRHLCLLGAFSALIVVPVAATVAPSVPFAITLPTQEVAAQPVSDPTEVSTVSTMGSDVKDGVARTVARWPVLSAFEWLLAIWMVGVIAFLVPVLVGLWQVRSLRRSGLPWRGGQSLAESITGDVRLRRRVDVVLHEQVSGPMTFGVLHPTILLPVDAEAWGTEDLQRALVHEVEHVRRHDWTSQCVTRVLCAVYWFHPFVWVAWRQLNLEAERACDDAVLGRADATAYADQLVALARRLSGATKAPVLAMANRHDLATRVNAVLDRRQSRGRPGRFLVGTVCALSAVVVASVSPLRMIGAQAAAREMQSGAPPVNVVPKFDVVSIRPCDPSSFPPGARGGGGGGTSSPGRLREDCQSLMGLIQMSYLLYANGRVNPPWAVLGLPLHR